MMHPSPSHRTSNCSAVSRRSFLGRTAALAAALGVPTWFLERELAAAPAPASKSPNARPGVALIGCGGMGRGDAKQAANFGDIVAVCDVDAKHAAEAAKQFTVEGKAAPTIYRDFRQVLARQDVHAIINGTPDHWHTLINLAAAKAGKDVYSEKPLTLTIDEGRRLVQAVQRSGIVLQTGTQQRSSVRFRLACELVRNGRLGQLKQVTVWLPEGVRGGPFATAPVPEGLDWDFWQGQAKWYDYVPERCHRTFRNWWDYSGGTMTDWGAHHNDIAYWAIGLLAPTHVVGRKRIDPVPGGYTAFNSYEVDYTYENGVKLAVRTTPDDNPFGGVVKPDGQRNGIRFEGTAGWLWVNRSEISAHDKAILTQPLPDGATRLYESKNHMGNFFECLQTRKAPICDVETGHRSATMCHIATTALRTGLPLQWDARAERFVGEHAQVANRYLAREMRKPYDYSFA